MFGAPIFRPTMRVELKDVIRLIQSSNDNVRAFFERLFQGNQPGGTVFDGFYIQVPEQASDPGRIRVINGYALSRLGERLVTASQTEDRAGILFEEPNIAKSPVLIGTNRDHYLEIEFTVRGAIDDARGYWDPSVDNGSDPSGDPRPDGGERSLRLPSRDFIDWKISTRPSNFSYEVDFGNSTTTFKVPLAVISLDGSGEVSNETEPAHSTVLVTPTDVKVRVHDTRLLFGKDVVAFFAKDGTPRLNGGGLNEWLINSVDYRNHVITLSEDPSGKVESTDSFRVINTASGVVPVYIKESRGQNVNGDSRHKYFSEFTDIDVEGLIADYLGLTPKTNTADNSVGVSGPNDLNIQDGPLRTDTRLKDLASWIKVVEFVINEIKHGLDFGATQDVHASGNTDYNIETWVGTHGKGEVDNTRNIPLGSLQEIGNARAFHPFGLTTRRIQHSTLGKHLSSIRQSTIIVGPNEGDGDFYGAQGLANAIEYVSGTLGAQWGTIYIKNGFYDLSTVDFTNLPLLTAFGSVVMPPRWSLIGESLGGVVITVPLDKQFGFSVGGTNTPTRLGQILENITFVSAAGLRTESLVNLIVYTTAAAMDNSFGRYAAIVKSCTFIAEDGSSVNDGMVRISALDITTRFRRPIKFENCMFAVGGTDGMYHFEWSAKAFNGADLIGSVFPLPEFNDCDFLTLMTAETTFIDTSKYGCVLNTENAGDGRSYMFKYDNCRFTGGKEAANISEMKAWIFVTESSLDSFVRLSVSGCDFLGGRAEASTFTQRTGTGIYFDNLDGKLNVQASTFQVLQTGIWCASGRSQIDGCSFVNNVVGEVIGIGVLSVNKASIAGCSFKTDFLSTAKNSSEAKAYAQTIGIMVYRGVQTHTYGIENTLSDDPISATTLQISGTDFSELGCGISLAPLQDQLLGAASDAHSTILSLLEISGCNFFAISGPAIDCGVYTGGTDIRAVVGSFMLTGCNFHWCAWRIFRDIFTDGTGQFPSNLVTVVNQFNVMASTHRLFVQGNTFNLIGMSGYQHGLTFQEWNTSSGVRRFLAVLGNDIKHLTRTVVVKNNTFVGYSNFESQAVDPQNANGDTTNGKQQSWAGCFWLGSTDATKRNNGVSVTIEGNVIDGDLRVGLTLGQPKASDGYGQNGFWIAGLAGSSFGSIKMIGNSFTLNRGQHGLYLDSTVSWHDIVIQNNFIKSLDAYWGASHDGYPSAADKYKVHLIHIEGWHSLGTYQVDNDGGISGPSSVSLDVHPLSIPCIDIKGNTFVIEGVRVGINLFEGDRAAVLVTSLGTGTPNGVFQGNTFKNCSLTLGESSALTISYRYIVVDNVFAGDLPDWSEDDAGFFRAIFCLNHTQGDPTNVGGSNYRPMDTASICVFRGNSVFNGTATFKAGNANTLKWGVPNIAYVLHLIGNTFYGRGGGRDDSAAGSPAIENYLVKSCFDFLGGDISNNPAVDDLLPPNSGTNLEAITGGSDAHNNKVIFVAMNVFPANVGDNDCLFVGDENTNLRTAITIAGDTTINTDAFPFVVASNVQMIRDEVGSTPKKGFNISGTE